MGLLSFLKRQPAAASDTPDPADAVQRARTQARRRLMGAVVLLGVGVIGFPLLFETQPRPIPVDLPIDIPRKEGAAPLAVPPARPQARAEAPAPAAPVVTERADEAGREVPPPVVHEAPKREAARPEPAKPEKPAEKTEKAEKPEKPVVVAREDADRARALLEGRPNADAAKAADGANRFVVQVGAFAEASAAREARGKVEKLGLKTYTQVVETGSGPRTRVRVGPFASREEADKASARLKSAGLSAAVLTL